MANSFVGGDYILSESPTVEVFAGQDCRQVLAGLKDRCEASGVWFDTAFADPPFNIGVSYDKHVDKMSEAEYAAFTYEWVQRLADVLRPGGTMWINCPEASLLLTLQALDAAKMIRRRLCVWHYRFGQNQKHNFISSHVNALYYVKPGAEHSWFPDRILEASDRASMYKDPRTYDKDEPEMRGLRVPLDVWYGPGFGRVQGNNKQRRVLHKNQLPVAYVQRALNSVTPDRGLVIDPFVGSGTTLVAARTLGFSSVGIDLSEAYAKSAFDNLLEKGKHEPKTI